MYISLSNSFCAVKSTYNFYFTNNNLQLLNFVNILCIKENSIDINSIDVNSIDIKRGGKHWIRFSGQ